jgi:predicted ArsR family transcriptional regulator
VKNYWKIRELHEDVKYWVTDSIKDLANKVGVIRTLLTGYLKALENQDYVMSERIMSAKVYFSSKGVEYAK